MLTKEQIKQAFDFIDYDNLSDAQYNLVLSFAEQWEKRGTLSERQCEALQSICRQSVAKEQKYPWERRHAR